MMIRCIHAREDGLGESAEDLAGGQAYLDVVVREARAKELAQV